VRRAARTAGIEALVSPHFPRHSHGTHAHRGADLAAVRETLGHASLSTTDALSPRATREIQRRLSRRLTKAV
jgi:site-specific recombinase XerD